VLNPLLCLTYPHGELADDFFSPRDIILSVPLGCRRSLSSPFHHALHQPLITPRNFFLLTRHSRRYARFRLLCSIKKVSIPSKLWEGVLSFELDNTSSRRRLQVSVKLRARRTVSTVSPSLMHFCQLTCFVLLQLSAVERYVRTYLTSTADPFPSFLRSTIHTYHFDTFLPPYKLHLECIP